MSAIHEKIKSINNLLVNLSMLVRGDKPTATAILAMAEMLAEDFEPEEVAIACKAYLIDGIFFPAYSELRKQLKDPKGEAWEAWRGILEHIKRQGYMNQPKNLSVAAQKALDAVGGYQHLCEMQSHQLNINAAQFVKAYDAMQKREYVQKQFAATSDGALVLDISSKLLKPMP